MFILAYGAIGSVLSCSSKFRGYGSDDRKGSDLGGGSICATCYFPAADGILLLEFGEILEPGIWYQPGGASNRADCARSGHKWGVGGRASVCRALIETCILSSEI